MAQTYDGREDQRDELDGTPVDAGSAEQEAQTRPIDSNDGETAQPPADELTPRRKARKPATRPRAARREGGEPVVALSRRKTLSDEVEELEAQGFTEDEAVRLISVSERVAHSGEAREAEELLRRLRFTRWLVEHGMLDEFSA
ncbi:MAG TPA: hypothetical protein VJQ45_05690 [Ktedonobacterales bacterium]|nr:hypothetical protein [Ktedonobacterales bacterium]